MYFKNSKNPLEQHTCFAILRGRHTQTLLPSVETINVPNDCGLHDIRISRLCAAHYKCAVHHNWLANQGIKVPKYLGQGWGDIFVELCPCSDLCRKVFDADGAVGVLHTQVFQPLIAANADPRTSASDLAESRLAHLDCSVDHPHMNCITIPSSCKHGDLMRFG